MQIVHLAAHYWPHRGGVETHVGEVSRALIAAGHRVTVVTQPETDQAPEQETWQGQTIVRLPSAVLNQTSWRYKLTIWRWWWQHRELLHSADVIQVHDVGWWLLPVWWLVRPKLFITFHGWETTWPIPTTAKVQRWFLNTIARGSVHVGAWIQEFYWDRPDLVTYGGVSDSLPLPRWPSSRTKLRVTFVGRLEADNDIDSYLTALRLLRDQHVPVSVTWVGDGSWRPQCEEFGTVTGWIDNPTSQLQKADVVLASSYLSILEAQAMGKPVISAYSLPLKERYLQTYPGSHWLRAESQPAAIAQCITSWLHPSPTEQAHVKLAAAWARQQTWAKVAELYLELWSRHV